MLNVYDLISLGTPFVNYNIWIRLLMLCDFKIKKQIILNKVTILQSRKDSRNRVLKSAIISDLTSCLYIKH